MRPACFVVGFFFRPGQVLRRQLRIASSLRSRALPTGRCGLQPSPRSYLPDVAHSWYDAELVSDQPSDSRTNSGVGEAVRLGAFQQQRRQAFPLRGV